MKWVTSGFEGFRQGTFGNGGQNIYVSKAGVLQRIHQPDINRNGYIDLLESPNAVQGVYADMYARRGNKKGKAEPLWIYEQIL